MSKFTPGPWVAKPAGCFIDKQGNATTTPTGYRVEPIRCELIVGDHNADRTAANARLISAAPDLLAALQSMIEWANADPSGTYPGGYPGTKAAAAIAKAVQS